MMRRTLRSVSTVVIVCLFCAAPATADLVASIQPESPIVQVGSSSYFDVFVTGTSATGDAVAGYTVTIQGQSGLSYTGVTAATDAPNGYIYPGSTPDPQPSALPDMQYIDAGASPNTITTGETFGAGRVFFDALAVGTYSISFVESQTGFFRADLTDVPTAYSAGTIIVAEVPEPSTTVLLGLAGVAGVGVSRLRKRRQPTTTAA